MPALRNRPSARTAQDTPVASLHIAPAAARAVALVSLALLASAPAFAAPPRANPSHAPIKWVDANGRVHYSDRQPSPDALGGAVKTQTITARSSSPSIGDPALPWALRSAAARYPVTLYTSPDCEPCELARTHLAQRGVPYTEKRVNDAADLKAYRALGFDKALFPSVSIGREKLVGFESVGWDRALDATGYPKTSLLPARRDARTLAPMREDSRVASSAAGDAEATDSGGGETKASDVESLLSPASFRTGPNPIRF
ncbi:MAG TPA: glutaredoxin family protein [Zeimonas sp.]